MKQIKLPTNTFQTSSVHVAGMLWALGFRLRKDAPVIRIIDVDTKQHTDQFHFNPTAETKWGKASAFDCFKIWRFGAESVEGKNIPPMIIEIIEHISAAQKNRPTMIAVVKAKVEEGLVSQYTRQVLEDHDNAVVLMPLDASDDLKRKMRNMIEGY